MNFKKVIDKAKGQMPKNAGRKVYRFGKELLRLCLTVVILAVILAVVVTVPVGYVKNVIGFARCDFEPSYRAEAIRTAGILIPPVGVIAGWMEIDDKPGTDQ